MEYPIPTHLRDIYVIDEERSDENGLEGSLKCSCAGTGFALNVYADILDNYISVREKNGGFAFVVAAVCSECGKKHVIMDLSKHGYDGFVCEEGVLVDADELEPYTCPQCQSNDFEVKLEIETEDREQFIEEVVEDDFLGEFKPEDYVDAFNWLVISIKCRKCGQDYKRWTDLELA